MPGDGTNTARNTAARAPAPQIAAALALRSAAYARDDRAAWVMAVRTLGGSTAAREDAAAYDVLRAMGVRTVEYGQPRLVDGLVSCELRYAVHGFDAVPARADTRWAAGVLPPLRVQQPVFPWEEPGAVARRGPGAVVIAVGGQGAADLHAQAEAAVAAVRTVCGGAAPPAVVVLPHDAATFGRWSGQTGDLNQIPAVTVGPVTEGRSAGCDRIVVNPQLWLDLAPAGRRVVLAHEAAHLLLRRDASGNRPAWLDEGFCEYVAYAGSEATEAAIAAPLVRQVRRAGVPAGLPDHMPGDPGSEDPAPGEREAAPGPGSSGADLRKSPYADRAAAYAAGLLACRVIAEHAGVASLVRLTTTARGIRSVDPGVLGPLRRSTGWALTDLERAWRERVRSVAARA